MMNLQDATLQVKEDEAPAKEDVKFNSGGSESFLMVQCNGKLHRSFFFFVEQRAKNKDAFPQPDHIQTAGFTQLKDTKYTT